MPRRAARRMPRRAGRGDRCWSPRPATRRCYRAGRRRARRGGGSGAARRDPDLELDRGPRCRRPLRRAHPLRARRRRGRRLPRRGGRGRAPLRLRRRVQRRLRRDVGCAGDHGPPGRDRRARRCGRVARGRARSRCRRPGGRRRRSSSVDEAVVDLVASGAARSGEGRLRRPRARVGGEVRARRAARRRARRRGRRVARRGRRRLRAAVVPGRPDRGVGVAAAVCRARHLRRDPAQGRHADREDDRRDQQGRATPRSSRSPTSASSATCSPSCRS